MAINDPIWDNVFDVDRTGDCNDVDIHTIVQPLNNRATHTGLQGSFNPNKSPKDYPVNLGEVLLSLKNSASEYSNMTG